MAEYDLVIKSKKSKLKGEDDYRVISVRIKKSLIEELDGIAERSGRSRNELIGTFLDYATRKCIVED